jgi:hypothetical protein
MTDVFLGDLRTAPVHEEAAMKGLLGRPAGDCKASAIRV